MYYITLTHQFQLNVERTKALLTGAWWIILIPGVFLVVTLLCITSIGDCIRKKLNKQESNL